MERTLLVTIKFHSEKSPWKLEDSGEELEELVSACGAEIIDNISCVRERPTANFFIGKGKVEEIAMLCAQEEIDTVVFSHDLSGTQQRNLEDIIGKKTIDRTQLILDIFSRHARSPEGKMQVELAQLQYLLPRLIGAGVILSRTGGGIGTSGPGEQKLEVDRRRIRKRLDKLKNDIRHLSLHRKTTRKRRKDNSMPVVALVGYTNAGKSTLINTLTGALQVVSNSLFTTLDPLYKSLQLPNGENIVISDTVGFLHNLPHHLIEAFKATLEEVIEADLIIHVLDVSHPRVYQHNQAVMDVLKEMEIKDKPLIIALNKIDLVDDLSWLEHTKNDFSSSVLISAKFRKNLDLLLNLIQNNFSGRMVSCDLLLPHSRMGMIDLFYREGRVEKIDYLQEGIRVEVSLPRPLYDKVVGCSDIKELNKGNRKTKTLP